MIVISDHAYQRAKERLSLNKSAIEKLAARAFYTGITHKDSKGSLRKYIDKLWFKNKSVANIRIYGEVIFFFRETVLVTVYQVPNNLRKNLKYCKK